MVGESRRTKPELEMIFVSYFYKMILRRQWQTSRSGPVSSVQKIEAFQNEHRLQVLLSYRVSQLYRTYLFEIHTSFECEYVCVPEAAVTTIALSKLDRMKLVPLAAQFAERAFLPHLL